MVLNYMKFFSCITSLLFQFIIESYMGNTMSIKVNKVVGFFLYRFITMQL